MHCPLIGGCLRAGRGRNPDAVWWLTPENLQEAVTLTGAEAVDVSSGVEERPGVKDPMRIKAFLEKAREL